MNGGKWGGRKTSGRVTREKKEKAMKVETTKSISDAPASIYRCQKCGGKLEVAALAFVGCRKCNSWSEL